MSILKKYWKLLLGVCIGAVGGFSYYYFIGCNGATCPLTSKPLPSTAWGALIGLVWAFPEKIKEKK